MKSGHLTLRKKMLLALLASFLPMLLAITLLFDRSIRVQHRAHVQAISYTAQDISKTLDRFTEGVYSVSDAFSTDERLLEILDRSYSDNPNAKKYAITYTNGALFESYSRLVKQKKIDAIYVVNRHDVLDFLDPNQTTTLLIKNFEALGMNDAQKFGKFYFYPLQENFLRTERYGEVRRDQVVLGSRIRGCALHRRKPVRSGLWPRSRPYRPERCRYHRLHRKRHGAHLQGYRRYPCRAVQGRMVRC